MIDFYNEDCVAGLKQYEDKYFDLAIVDPLYEPGIFIRLYRAIEEV